MSYTGIIYGGQTRLDEYFAACRNEIIRLTYQGQLVGFRLFVTKPWEGKLRFEYLEFSQEYVTSEEKRKFITENQALWRTLEMKAVDDKLVVDDEINGDIQITELMDENLIDKWLGYAIIGIQRREDNYPWQYCWFSMLDYPRRINESEGCQIGTGFRCFVRNANNEWVREKKDYVVRDFVYNPPNSKVINKNKVFKKFISNVKRNNWNFTQADIESAGQVKNGRLVYIIDKRNLPSKVEYQGID